MTTFWMIALALSLAAAAFVLLPLFMKRSALPLDDRQGLNVAIYTERLAEYQLTLEGNDITQDEFAVLELELKKNLLSDVDSEEELVQNNTIQSKRVPIVIAVLIPLFAIFSYSDFGLSWGAINDVALAEEMKATDPHDKKGMGDSVGKLAIRLREQPDNHEGWFLLAQSYLNMAEFEKSAAAFKVLADKFPQDHGIASYYAEAVYLADSRVMTPRSVAAIDKTLSLDPNNVTMLELKAMGAFQNGELTESLAYFQRALASNPDPDRAELIERAVGRLKEDLVAQGLIPADVVPADEEKSKDAQSSGEQGVERQIQVMVDVADSVEVGASMSVFVFARAETGPPMPLAVERLVRGALPKLITLDESMAMMQGMGLANFDRVQVVARISSSGIANVSPDDYQALSEIIDLTKEVPLVKLTLEKQVKDF